MQPCPQRLCGSFWVRKIDLVKMMRIIIRVWFYLESSLGRVIYLFTNILCDVNQKVTWVLKFLHSLENKRHISTSVGDSHMKLFLCETRAKCFANEKCIICGTLNECVCKIINNWFLDIVPLFSWLTGLRGVNCFRQIA